MYNKISKIIKGLKCMVSCKTNVTFLVFDFSTPLDSDLKCCVKSYNSIYKQKFFSEYYAN